MFIEHSDSELLFEWVMIESALIQAVPVHVLPKLEYQLCYGAESLTHTEACQLWAEKLLHSSTVSFISKRPDEMCFLSL